MDIKKIFFFKGINLLIKIKELNKKDCYGLKLSKFTNIGYARVHQLLNCFEKEGIIKFEKLNKRTNIVTLTDKGEKLTENFIKIKQLLKK